MEEVKLFEFIKRVFNHVKLLYILVFINTICSGMFLYYLRFQWTGSEKCVCSTDSPIHIDNVKLVTHEFNVDNVDKQKIKEGKRIIKREITAYRDQENDICRTFRRCNIKGPPGKPGSRGLPGPKGDRGNMGVSGVTGNPGPVGPPGDPGLPGPVGPQGPKGEEGLAGLRGQLGPQGPKGEMGRVGMKGEPGEKGSRGLLGFPGPDGEQGLKGDRGEPGFPGNQGLTGPRGLRGLNGTKGEPGKRGRRGQDGQRGPRGYRGYSGNQGIQGSKGEKGDRGERGLQNTECQCVKGEKGDRGQIGFTGYKGDTGDQGQKGERGFSLPGHKGAKGDKGDCEAVMENWKLATTHPHNENDRPGCETDETPTTETPTTELTTELTTEATTSSTTISTTVTTPKTTESTTTKAPPIPLSNKRDCNIRMVGIPLFIRKAGPVIGAWLHDPANQKEYPVWETRGNSGKYLYEYKSKRSFMEYMPDRTHKLLAYDFQGFNHAIYDGSFYYQSSERSVACYDIGAESITSGFKFEGIPSPLYQIGNYFDIEVDENGLWIIYARNGKIIVSKINIQVMRVVRRWEIDRDPLSYGNGFIACGVLYLIRTTSTQRTEIDFAYDLYRDKPIPSRMRFINPYVRNFMVSYYPNLSFPSKSLIYAWDNGRQISYQLLM